MGTNNLMVNQPSNLPLYPVEGGYSAVIASMNDIDVEITELLELNNSLPFDIL